MKRRRKTPETDIAAEIRKYAKGYAAAGQREHADGMLQAADMVDGFMAKMGLSGTSKKVHSMSFESSSLETRVAELERIVSMLVSEPSATPERPEPRPKPNGAPLPIGEAQLSPGEIRILRAIVQGPATNDELTAMVDLRATSLRTYLGNLRAAGYVETSAGRHQATSEGVIRVEHSEPIPYGRQLLEWWLDGRLSPGEAKLLRAVSADGTTAVSNLIGEATGLQATSVRTYLNNLSRRKLIVRSGRGSVSIAPWLTDGN